MTYNNTGVIGPAGRRHPDQAEGRPSPDRRVCARVARGTAAAVSRHDLLVPARRHRQPDPQFRRAGADRPADPRRQSGGNFAYANKLLSRIRRIPGVADARIQQSPNAPTFNVDVDRTRAQYVGLTERDVTNSLVVNLAGSAPGRADLLAQSRQRRVLFDRDADAAIPDQLAERAADPADHGDAATRNRRSSAASPTSSGPTPAPWCRNTTSSALVQIYATTQGRDLGAVATDVRGADRRNRQGRAERQLRGAARPGADHEQRVLRACCSACLAPSC